ncbi:MAG: hypothetical protein IKW95_07340 [Lachnospiraceae bacterium]|nr:hypothetical protein [Lachnospiraceae bacterium]
MSFRWKKKEVLICFLAVFGMGFFLSFLILCNLGTDPATFMNRSVADFIGMSFGNWQLIINIVMLSIVILLKRSLIGFGTVFNMVLIGYYADFFCWLFRKTIPAEAFTDPLPRWCIFGVTLFGFILSAAIYINADMGVSPYDGLPIILTEKITARAPKIPPMVIRIAWDGFAIAVGTVFGGTPIIGIILMALFLGPAITLVRKIGDRLREKKKK